MAKGKGKFKVEFYHGDHDADHSHVPPRAEYFDLSLIHI